MQGWTMLRACAAARVRGCERRPMRRTVARRAGAAALLLTLCAALFAALGDLGPADAQETLAGEDTVSIYLLARVHPLPPGDARGAWRIEFGVLPASTVRSAGGGAAAATANERLLPERRYLSESAIRGRAQAGNSRWFMSSRVSIPLGDSGGAVLDGRVIARWNPRQDGGPLRLEFGFLPESARTAAEGDIQATARAHAVLPESRYLPVNAISGELRLSRPRWFRSSAVGALFSSGLRTPTIAWRGYAPGEATLGGAVPRLLPPTATVNGVAVQLQYRYRVAPVSVDVCSVGGDGVLTILQAGDCRVQATSVATARYRSATASVSVQVGEDPELDPELRWAGYAPATARIGDPPRAPLPPTAAHPSIGFRYQSRTPANCGVDPTTGELMFLAAGPCSVTVSTVGGENYRAAEVTVTVEITEEERVTPVVTWSGYPNDAVTVGEPPTSPTPPRAAVGGAAVNLLYKFSTESTGVCRVDENVGLLTPLGEGVCMVTATSVETAQYLPATATAQVSVRPRLAAPTINWA